MAESDPQLMTVFGEALDRSDPAERAAYLDAACAGNPDLRRRVDALLTAHAAAGNFLEPSPATDATATFDPDAPAAEPDPLADVAGITGQLIGGRYKLIEVVGEGGMGTVWMAQQTEPVKRVVAVKVLKAGLDSSTVLARFDAERQALAMMDHPNIAKVLDAGATVSGHPFFVMELVKGVPITRFCDERKLTPDARLALFVQVCHAIQHAHMKGVIHRDIKPSNVLVALYDDRPVPKVIDFGVAKATGPQLTEQTLQTGFGAVVGTPEYMSPEQASFNQLDVDTRSDVYALGVLLYELLTGTTPVDRKSLGKAALLEVLRIVREVDAPRPSVKLSTSYALPTISANRGLEPKKLTGLLRSELDWIVLKSLEKDRDRRYDTANGFAADIQRYLAGEAVQAHPPSRRYRAAKFVRRHRPQVLAAGLVFLALLAGLAGTAWQASRAESARVDEKTQRELAQANEREANAAREDANIKRVLAEKAADEEKAARQAKEQERKYAQAIADFVKDDFLALTSVEGQDRFGGKGLDRTATLLDLLNRAAEKLKARKDLDPRIEAELCGIVGISYRGIGDAAKGISFLERAVELRTQVLGADAPETLDDVNSLCVAYVASDMPEKALPLYKSTLKLRKAKLGPNHPETLRSMANLASCCREAGKIDEALPLLEETLELRKINLGPDHPDTLISMGNLVKCYRADNQKKRAQVLAEDTFARMRHKFGADHRSTLTAMTDLAACYVDVDRIEDAEKMFEKALELMTAKLGRNHSATISCISNLAYVYWTQERLNKSVPLFEECLRCQEKQLGRSHPQTLLAMANLGRNYLDAGRPAEAIPLLEEAYRALKRVPTLRWVAPLILSAYVRAERPAGLTMLYGEVLANARKLFPDDVPRHAAIMARWGQLILQAKGYVEAEPVLRECLAIREKLESDVWTTFNTQSMLGGALFGQKKYTDAEQLLVNGYKGLEERRKAIPKVEAGFIPEALDRLIALYTATKKPDEVKKYREVRAKYPPELAPRPKPVK